MRANPSANNKPNRVTIKFFSDRARIDVPKNANEKSSDAMQSVCLFVIVLSFFFD